MTHDAFHLKLAFQCLRTAQPIRWREVREKCRTSRVERKNVLRDLRAHPLFGLLCIYNGVKQ